MISSRRLILAVILLAGAAILPDDVLAQAPAQVVGPAPVPAGEQTPGFMDSLFQLLPMMLICYLIFYFMVVKPQDKKAKSQKELLDGLKRGETLVTTGGIVGKFSGMEKDLVLLEVSPNVRVKIVASNISRRLEPAGEAQAA